jgi:hypothetical protein
MTTTKQALRPSEGIYYVVPQKSGAPMILAQREDEVEDAAHMFFWEKVLKVIKGEYKLSDGDVEDLLTHYTAIPRGRVSKELDPTDPMKTTGKYKILHGGDAPIAQIRNFVLTDFGLLQLDAAKRVSWEVSSHEKMDKEDRSLFLSIIKRK